MPMPTGVHCEGWGKTQLNHHHDAELQAMDAFASVASINHLEWYFFRIRGWVVEMFEATSWQANLHPGRQNALPAVGWIDLRKVYTVRFERNEELGAADSRAKFIIILGLREGYFDFRVQTEREAILWVQAVEHLGFEHLNNRCKDVPPGAPNADRHPEKFGALTRIWAECVRNAAEYLPLPNSEIRELYALYDQNGDDDIDVEEIRRMIWDLTHVRQQNLVEFLEKEKKRSQNMASLQRLQKEANLLLKIYQDLFRKDGFEKRMFLIRQRLDTTRDGIIGVGEFLVGAAHFVMMDEVLSKEATFYTLGHETRKQTFASRHQQSGGCLAQ